MPTMPEKTRGEVSDAAVQAATRRTWAEWFAELDAAGAGSMRHPAIVAVLAARDELSPWWQQTVAVRYEQARGLREKHEKPDGYSVSATKTIAAPIDRAFAAWSDQTLRASWLGEPVTIRKATPEKSLRITWTDGTSNVEVNFYPKPAGRCQVAVQHGRLPNAAAAARMKAFWRDAVARLKSLLEG